MAPATKHLGRNSPVERTSAAAAATAGGLTSGDDHAVRKQPFRGHFTPKRKTAVKYSGRLNRWACSSHSGEQTDDEYSLEAELDNDASSQSDRIRADSGELEQLLMRLGRPKEAVPPGTFNGEDGTSLRTFLDRYERYFSLKYEGNDHDCAVGLANFLRGTALGAYIAMSGSHIKYSRLNPFLLIWYKSERTSVRQQKLDDFTNAKYQFSEFFRLYCLGLEQLAEKASPGNLAERKKFRETVPPFFLNKLENAQSAVSAMGDGKLTWQRMKKVAETKDMLRKKNSCKGNGGELDTSVWFNSSKPVVESSRNSTHEGRTRRITPPVNSRGRGNQTFGRGVGNSNEQMERKSPPNEKQVFQYCAWCR